MPLVQIALCLLAYALVGWYFGRLVVVWTAPLFAYAIARPLMALVIGVWQRLRERVWLPVHGQHYVFHGITIHVQEDDDHWRWVCLADVRKVLGETPADRTLASAWPARVKAGETAGGTFMRADALAEYLGKQHRMRALRLRTWVERNLVFPARRAQTHAGALARREPAGGAGAGDPDRPG